MTAAWVKAPTMLNASNKFLASLTRQAVALCLCSGRSRQNEALFVFPFFENGEF